MLNKIMKHIRPMLDTIAEAIEYLITLEVNNSDRMIADIKEFITAINDVIIKDTGKSGDSNHSNIATAVAAGEKLSEILEQYYSSNGIEEILTTLQEYRSAIEHIPVKYKAVFLPYYDNTWDSLESVYEAFSADPLFETEIVIIPILRNTPTGAKHVYEDFLTPQGIPNTNYNDYDFATDQPDIVFFNNPYDGVNYPKFQTKNIKPFVQFLVYIPYYLYMHEYTHPSEMPQVLSVRAELPGHDSADVFVVHGESFYNSFAFASRNGKKMVALGNPKSDYLYKRMMSNDWPRYNEWDTAVKGRTTFLLNTHYSSFFSNPHPFLVSSSMKSWLRFLFELVISDENLALIWRPHPQMFLMLDSLVGEWKQLYQDCISMVDNCERIVLDRTSNVISAFMYCDAVISEYSSIMSEAVCLDKPVFMCGLETREYRENYKEYYSPEYSDTLKQTRSADSGNLTLYNALPCSGADSFLLENESVDEIIYQKPLRNFIYQIKEGIDNKGDLRRAYRKQLLNNYEGSCGKAICDYMKSKVIEE